MPSVQSLPRSPKTVLNCSGIPFPNRRIYRKVCIAREQLNKITEGSCSGGNDGLSKTAERKRKLRSAMERQESKLKSSLVSSQALAALVLKDIANSVKDKLASVNPPSHNLYDNDNDNDGTVMEIVKNVTEAMDRGQVHTSHYRGVYTLILLHCKGKNDGTETHVVKDHMKNLLDLCVGSGGSFNKVRGVGGGGNGDDQDEDDALPNTVTITGDERLELMRRLLDEFKWERQENQVEFHEAMMKTALPCIFMKEWDTDYDRILRMFNLYQHYAETFIICPRRFGKTVSVGMFCAGYMYAVPDASIAIFSTAQRTSGKMMLAIYGFMRELPYFADAIFTVRNSETICITLHGKTRTMWCYPGKVGVCTAFGHSFSSFHAVASLWYSGLGLNKRYV